MAVGAAELSYFSIRVTVREATPTANQRFGGIVATDGFTSVIAPTPTAGAGRVVFIDGNELERTVPPPEE